MYWLKIIDQATDTITVQGQFYDRFDAFTAAIAGLTGMRRQDPDKGFTMGQLYAARDLWRPGVHGQTFQLLDPDAGIDVRIACVADLQEILDLLQPVAPHVQAARETLKAITDPHQSDQITALVTHHPRATHRAYLGTTIRFRLDDTNYLVTTHQDGAVAAVCADGEPLTVDQLITAISAA